MNKFFNKLGNITINSINTILNNRYFKNSREKLIQTGIIYGIGAMNTIFYKESAFFDITDNEIKNFKSLHPSDKYFVLYKLLNKIFPKEKKITIKTKKQETPEHNEPTDKNSKLSEYINPSDHNLLGYINENADKPLDDISRLLLPFKFSNLSWYINNQLINNIDYVSLLEIITLLDAFIIIEDNNDYFYKYVQKIKLTGLTIVDVEFLLSLLWLIMEADLNEKYQDVYNYEKNNPTDTKYTLHTLNNIFNIIFHIDNVNITGINTAISILKNFGVTDVFFKDIKELLINKLIEPYKSKCNEQIHTLTFAQYIASLLLSIKNNSLLSCIDLGCFQEIFDKVLHKQPKINLNKSEQHGGSIVTNVILSLSIKPILSFIYSKSIFVLSSVDTMSRRYLDFLYTKNITYNELKNIILKNEYSDSFIYIIEDPKNNYPYLRALLLTIEFKEMLTPTDRIMFIKKEESPKSDNLFYRKPETIFTPFKNSFTTAKLNIIHKYVKSFDISFIFIILGILGGSWGDLIKSYDVIVNKLSTTDTIRTYEYLLYNKSEKNIFSYPARLILNSFDAIQKNNKLVEFIRQLMLYQLIFTNTYLLIVDTIAERNIINGKIIPSESNYKHASKIASKIANLLYKKNIESINSIISAYVNKNDNIFNNKNDNDIFCKCIDFNHAQNIILEIDKHILAEKLGFSKYLSNNPSQHPSQHESTHQTLNVNNVNIIESQPEHIVLQQDNTNTPTDNIFYNTINNSIKLEKINKNSLIREKIFNFFKRIFQYNLALTSFDIEHLLEFSINNTIVICDETQYILEFYKNKEDIYELYIPTDLTKKIKFIEYY